MCDTFRSHFDRVSRFDDVELELPQIERNERIERTPEWDWVDTDTPAFAKNRYGLYTSIVGALWLSLIFEYPEKFNRRIPLFRSVKISGMFEHCKNQCERTLLAERKIAKEKENEGEEKEEGAGRREREEE